MEFYELVTSHLRALFGSLFWKQRVGDSSGHSIECWNINGKTLLIQTFSDGTCEVFTPIDESNNIDTSMEKLNSFLRG